MTHNLKKHIKTSLVISLCIFAFNQYSAAQTNEGFTNLIDGHSLGGWNIIGNANWNIGKGMIEGKSTPSSAGFLVSQDSYKNFIIRAEFWSDEDANSGIFIRCQNRNKIGSDSCYEVNIFDKRPEQSYATGAIVDVAIVNPAPRAAGRWNTYEIIANGGHFKVLFNGQVTVEDGQNSKFSEGPIALQSAGGVVRFRSLLIKKI